MHPLLLVGQLLRVLKCVDGRKKLQKVVHILQQLGVPFTEPFEYSFHGMYSQQLRCEVDLLVSEGLVAEQPHSGPSNASYVYTAALPLSDLLHEFNLDSEPVWADTARRLNTFSPRQVEGISTLLFLRGRGLNDDEALTARLLELKPHLSNEAAFCLGETKRLAQSHGLN